MKKIIIAAFALVFFGSLLIFPFRATLQDVECQSQLGECSSSLRSEVKSFAGKSISQGFRELEKKLSSDPRVVEYSIKFNLPSVARVSLVERMPTVAISARGKQEFSLIDQSGFKIAVVSETNLPRVIIDSQESGDAEVLHAAEVLVNLNKMHSVKEGILGADGFKVKVLDNTDFIFPTSGDIDIQLGSAEILLFQLNSLLEKSKIEYSQRSNSIAVDLRYKNPVIRY